MPFYSNHSKSAAIVTLKLESTDNPKAALMIGSEAFLEKHEGAPGYLDIIVESGKELHLTNNTVATFVSVRSAS